VPRDDAESFAARAEAALGHAKRTGRGTVNIAHDDDPPSANGTLQVARVAGETILEA
jgi:hypothetical protein